MLRHGDELTLHYTHTEDENVAGSPPPSPVWNACVCSLVLAQLVQHIYISSLFSSSIFERAGAVAGASSKYILFRPSVFLFWFFFDLLHSFII